MMKKIAYGAVALLSLSLAACSTFQAPEHPNPESVVSNQQLQSSMAQAASSVSHSMQNLDATEQAAYPPQSIAESPNPSSYGMGIPTTLQWNGPIQPLIAQIASATNYKMKVLGKKPSIPVIVKINEHNTPVGNILQNAGLQAKDRAQVVVFPSTRTIELRYL